MPWWSIPLVILTPLVVFALAWSFGRVGDYGLQSPRRAFRIQAIASMIMSVGFLALMIIDWREGNFGFGFWVAMLGAIGSLIGLIAQARALRQTSR